MAAGYGVGSGSVGGGVGQPVLAVVDVVVAVVRLAVGLLAIPCEAEGSFVAGVRATAALIAPASVWGRTWGRRRV